MVSDLVVVVGVGVESGRARVAARRDGRVTARVTVTVTVRAVGVQATETSKPFWTSGVEPRVAQTRGDGEVGAILLDGGVKSVPIAFDVDVSPKV